MLSYNCNILQLFAFFSSLPYLYRYSEFIRDIYILNHSCIIRFLFTPRELIKRYRGMHYI